MFKLDNFGIILFVSFSYKKLLQCSFYKNWTNRFKNSKKFVYYNENMYTNSKFQTQLSRKLQRFRTCRKNKKCSIFHDLSDKTFLRFTMVYMHVLIGITRFICVFYPIKFRCLTRKHYLTLALLVYNISLIQGLVSNFLPW